MFLYLSFPPRPHLSTLRPLLKRQVCWHHFPMCFSPKQYPSSISCARHSLAILAKSNINISSSTGLHRSHYFSSQPICVANRPWQSIIWLTCSLCPIPFETRNMVRWVVIIGGSFIVKLIVRLEAINYIIKPFQKYSMKLHRIPFVLWLWLTIGSNVGIQRWVLRQPTRWENHKESHLVI